MRNTRDSGRSEKPGPTRAAVIVGISTAIGSAVPLLPFIFLPMTTAPMVALACAGLVLGVAGFRARRADRRFAPPRGAEMLVIGIVSAFAGYLIGLALRVPAA